MKICKENNFPICLVTEADGTMQQSECVEMLFDKKDAIMTLSDAMENRLYDLSGYVFSTLLVGEEAFEDDGFTEMDKHYHYCDKEDIFRGEILLYAFDLLLFSDRDFYGTPKAYVLIDNIDCHGATMRVIGWNHIISEGCISFSNGQDECLYDEVSEVFDELLKEVVKDIAECIIESDLYV